MPFKNVFKKKDQRPLNARQQSSSSVGRVEQPNITITRSDDSQKDTTSTALTGLNDNPTANSALRRAVSQTVRRRSVFRPRVHSRSYSANVPANLPSIEDHVAGNEDKESQWERRATILGLNPLHGKDDVDCRTQAPENMLSPEGNDGRPPSMTRRISDTRSDDDIQEAIRFHEKGDLEKSTAMFGRLANPNGANNALSQVLYGLALRHGWGIPTDPAMAITYLSKAASNAASIESQALSSGMNKGGAAKGELVLAIYELANCFRHGWGVGKDPVAARNYYETAANLGDTDAMYEAARCYEEGFGAKKNRFLAAKYYRLAEEKGVRTLGNSWIWKEKYNPKPPT